MVKMVVVWSAVLLGCGSSVALAQQADGPWMVRARAVYLKMDNSSQPGSGAGKRGNQRRDGPRLRGRQGTPENAVRTLGRDDGTEWVR